MVLVLQVECAKKVTICIAVNGVAMCSNIQICLPIAKRLAKPRVDGSRHKLRLTGLSYYVKRAPRAFNLLTKTAPTVTAATISAFDFGKASLQQHDRHCSIRRLLLRRLYVVTGQQMLSQCHQGQ